MQILFYDPYFDSQCLSFACHHLLFEVYLCLDSIQWCSVCGFNAFATWLVP